MRCLALAQAWQDAGGQAVFAFAAMPSMLEHRFLSEGFAVVRMPVSAATSEDAESTIEIARQRGATWVIVDGDHFDSSFLHRVRSAGLHLFLVDDFAARDSYPADLILNPNSGAEEASYRKRAATARLCLGESYVLLRREFSSRPASRAFPEEGLRVLVTLGGSDPENLSVEIVQALKKVPGCKVTAVAGPGHKHPAELQQLGSASVRVLVNPSDMRAVMEDADLAIIAAGGTLWELLYMECVVLSYARNPVQARAVVHLAERGAVRNMGSTQDLDEGELVAAVTELGQSRALREQMAKMGRQTVDGQGCLRVLEILREQGVCE
jgi:UDP-2,4-diacetamido-2,4,6-trideoxy-beta-L-altropyranose hydrolase